MARSTHAAAGSGTSNHRLEHRIIILESQCIENWKSKGVVSQMQGVWGFCLQVRLRPFKTLPVKKNVNKVKRQNAMFLISHLFIPKTMLVLAITGTHLL